jgi:hypothetical protein
MDIKAELIREHSKAQALKIANYIGSDEERFAELVQLFLQSDYRLNQRSAWVISHCVLTHPFLIKPYFQAFIQKLHEENIHDAVKRNIVRIWEEVSLPEEFWGEIYDICLGYLLASEPYAIKAFSMSVCYRISEKIPELKPELRILIEDLCLKHEEGSGAIRSRGKKILAKLKKNK